MFTDPLLVQKVLLLLREWGWESGVEKLKAEINDTAEDEKRGALAFFVGWIAGERGDHAEALRQFEAVAGIPNLWCWAQVGKAFVNMREGKYQQALELMNAAAGQCEQNDKQLLGTIAHCRGVISYHQGNRHALPFLHEALTLIGKDHFYTGRILDTLGMVYAGKDNFHAAREFYHRSLECKQGFDDDAGIALTHGQLGRLFLDWGNLRKAEEHFRSDLKLSNRIHDQRGVAQIHNYLGYIATLRGELEQAATLLDKSIRLAIQGGWSIIEGFARKDRAAVHLMQAELEAAERETARAQQIFKDSNFIEGMAYVNRIYGLIRRAQGRYDESDQLLNKALNYFDQFNEHSQVARTRMEIGRTMRAQKLPSSLVADQMLEALREAEGCRRDELVREIELEIKGVSEAAHYRHIYQRARGRDVAVATDSLLAGERDTATVMFLDVQGSTEYARSKDPEVVMMTLNQMMAEFEAIIDKYQVAVTAYLGDGFMALVRNTDHAKRAIMAALGLQASLEEFNLPRVVLGLQPLNIRIGIATGEVFIGNVGTYNKMDFTAIGTTANLAARLQSEAEVGAPCISSETYELTQNDFVFKTDAPRRINLKGLGERDAWDVVGKK